MLVAFLIKKNFFLANLLYLVGILEAPGRKRKSETKNGSQSIKGVLPSTLPLGYLVLNPPGNCGGQCGTHTLASACSRDERAGEFIPQPISHGMSAPPGVSIPWHLQPPLRQAATGGPGQRVTRDRVGSTGKGMCGVKGH